MAKPSSITTWSDHHHHPVFNYVALRRPDGRVIPSTSPSPHRLEICTGDTIPDGLAILTIGDTSATLNLNDLRDQLLRLA